MGSLQTTPSRLSDLEGAYKLQTLKSTTNVLNTYVCRYQGGGGGGGGWVEKN